MVPPPISGAKPSRTPIINILVFLLKVIQARRQIQPVAKVARINQLLAELMLVESRFFALGDENGEASLSVIGESSSSSR